MFAYDTFSVDENEGAVTVTLKLTRVSSENLTITIKTTDVTATGELHNYSNM